MTQTERDELRKEYKKWIDGNSINGDISLPAYEECAFDWFITKMEEREEKTLQDFQEFCDKTDNYCINAHKYVRMFHLNLKVRIQEYLKSTKLKDKHDCSHYYVADGLGWTCGGCGKHIKSGKESIQLNEETLTLKEFNKGIRKIRKSGFWSK